MDRFSILFDRATPFVKKALSMPVAAQLLFLSGIGSVAFALTMQMGFNVPPCDLCIWQRYPYGVVAALSLLCFAWRPYKRQTVILLALCALTFLVSAGFATVHSGVERHWWESPLACMGEEIKGDSVEDLRRALLSSESPPCDEIPWTLCGLSMANWNIVASLALAFFAAAAAKLAAKNGKQRSQ